MLGRLLARLRPEIPTLWYENQDGKRWVPPRTNGYPPEPPDGFIYQWSHFPRSLDERCLRAVLQSEVDECDHRPEYVVKTGGWVDGVKGRECRACHGTQVINEDEQWPLEWEANGSRELMSGSNGYPADLVMAMLRPSAMEIARQIYRYGLPAIPFTDFDQAVLHAAKSCERCLNALCYRYGVNDGYPKGSKEWHEAGTSCELCDPDIHERIRAEIDEENDL